MKKQILKLAIGLAAIAAITVACKKKEDDMVSPTIPVCLVTSYKDLLSNDSSVVTYDGNNRVIKTISYDKTGNLLDSYETYTYAPNKITYTLYSDATTIDNRTEYYLNANGTVNYDAEMNEDKVNGVTEYDTTFYTYDSQGYNNLIVYKTVYTGTHNSTTYDTSWNVFTGGNMTSSTIKYSSGETKTDKYTYTNLEDKGSVSLLSSNMYGVPSKNLPLLGTDDAGSYTEKYIYEQNTDGYLTRRRMEYVNTKYPSTYTSDLRFSYSCK